MIGIIQTIALLCQISGGASYAHFAFPMQKDCQKELALCVLPNPYDSKENLDLKLFTCIRDRK